MAVSFCWSLSNLCSMLAAIDFLKRLSRRTTILSASNKRAANVWCVHAFLFQHVFPHHLWLDSNDEINLYFIFGINHDRFNILGLYSPRIGQPLLYHRYKVQTKRSCHLTAPCTFDCGSPRIENQQNNPVNSGTSLTHNNILQPMRLQIESFSSEKVCDNFVWFSQIVLIFLFDVALFRTPLQWALRMAFFLPWRIAPIRYELSSCITCSSAIESQENTSRAI